VGFITLVANISINLFFSNYIKETRSKDDLKVVHYVEQLYSDNSGLDPQALMIIMHYAYSESVTVRFRDMQGNIIWSSGTPETMHDTTRDYEADDSSLAFQGYPLHYKDKKIATIDVGRPKSIISSLEDKQFLRTINSVFASAFLFSLVLAILYSSRISKRFLKPIYQIKENAKLIEDGKYKKLNNVETNTYELHDLSISVKELADRLDDQDTLRKRMTADIAHELRTPLSILQSHIEAFMDGVWEPDIEKLSVLHNEITRLTKLIKELSDLSVIEGDEIELNKSEINLSILLHELIDSFEPIFIGKNIHLHKKIQDDIRFFGDEEYMKRIIINIFSNACKYTNDDGDVKVTLEQLNDTLILTVEDSGIGIPKEDIRHVFERFYRSDLSRNRGTGGTGIGLTITRALVEAQNGKIRIESEVSKGTKVIIEFVHEI
ncbi:MAG TPA: sensor histidine kinase, partial [Clostridiales bacterium]|nr:sensor histidine kinase [Clostridiales bacterium]